MDMSIREYELQLQAVELSLQTTETPEDIGALNSLKSDLLELIELTKQADEENLYNEDQYCSNQEQYGFNSEKGKINSGGFKSSDEDKSNLANEEAELQQLKIKLEKKVGQKCSAPHQHTWGAKSYHNAIVCGIEDTANMDCNGMLKARLRVLFTNPTHLEMVPCPFYLEGECRFDDEHCHYSHGELIDAEELGAYVEPDFSRLARNCVVLAKLSDRLWHRGRVLCADFVERKCRVRLDRNSENKRESDFSFEDLLPIFHDDDLSSGSSSESCDAGGFNVADYTMTPRQTQLSDNTFFEFRPTQQLGEWEKHTRGIGSKLMAKMGYIFGKGLGSEGNGIVTPVTAQVLPPGISLDRCMELREAANGDTNLFSVNKKLKMQQKKQKYVNSRAYARESQRTDVFSFLNDNVLSSFTESKKTKKTKSLINETTKSLNVASVRIADNIRRKEKEIEKLQQSIERNSVGSAVYKILLQQLDIKRGELKCLQKDEKCLTREQATRITKDKLSIF